jgi:hypothetical protein
MRKAYHSFSGPGILRPGQYQQIVGFAPATDEMPHEDPDLDEMGIVHDRRFEHQSFNE